MRISPSCTTDATRVPSCVYICPKMSARAAWATGLSLVYSSQSSKRGGRWNQIAWSRLAEAQFARGMPPRVVCGMRAVAMSPRSLAYAISASVYGGVFGQLAAYAHPDAAARDIAPRASAGSIAAQLDRAFALESPHHLAVLVAVGPDELPLGQALGGGHRAPVRSVRSPSSGLAKLDERLKIASPAW